MEEEKRAIEKHMALVIISTIQQPERILNTKTSFNLHLHFLFYQKTINETENSSLSRRLFNLLASQTYFRKIRIGHTSA